MADPEILILGIGNPLAGDDGFGVEVVRRLRSRVNWSAVELLDGGSSGIYLLPCLEGRSHILVIDAVNFGGSPGEIVRLNAGDVPAFIGMKLSEHQVTFHEVLALSGLMNIRPREFLLIGAQPRKTLWGEGLSTELQVAAEIVATEVINQIQIWLDNPANPDKKSIDNGIARKTPGRLA
jgi:hydrogenase maturation protease